MVSPRLLVKLKDTSEDGEERSPEELIESWTISTLLTPTSIRALILTSTPLTLLILILNLLTLILTPTPNTGLPIHTLTLTIILNKNLVLMLSSTNQ
jgi:hypothetical protein